MSDSAQSPLHEKSTDTESRSKAQSILIIALIALMTEIVAFEFTLISPGLADIAVAFDTTHVTLVMTIPLLVGGVVVPIIGKLADVYGKKRILMSAGMTFLAGTAMCALTTLFPLFLAGRGLQACGLASSVVCYGLIRDLIPARWVPLGVGGIGVGIGASALIGPLLGGWLIDNFGYRSAFWFLLAYSAVVIVAIAALVPETTVRIAHRVDYYGAALLGLGASALILGAHSANVRTISFIGGALLLVLFVFLERRIAQPLISMSLVSRPGVWMTLLIAGAYGVVNGTNGALIPQMLRAPSIPGNNDSGMGLSALGYSVHYGLPQGVSAAACGLLAGWLSRKHSPRLAMLIGMIGALAGSLLVAFGAVGTTAMAMLLGSFMGIANGFFYSSSTNLLIEAVPANTQAVTGSMKFTSEQVAGALASAFLGAVVGNYVLMLNPNTGQPIPSMEGYHLAYIGCAVAAAVAIVVTLTMKHGRMPATGGVASGQTFTVPSTSEVSTR
ncbi:Multidrug resistance protein 3 [Rhodococcus erythropolis]|uniref:MFS transporter n=1 Tax=Rhodococcus erythropolis TaxID=1833 RepID=UPI001556C4A8|nr:MFS transporter [Rhodococcus erythropolis]PBI88815.1 Multidrug resistance protein 3 [Rhodococcus erythropolis]